MNTLERPRRSRRRRQRRGERRREAAAIVFVTLLALATISLVTWPLWKSPSPSAASGAPSSGAGNIELASVTTIPASTSHPVYKYSVIPGGARNGEELAQAIRHDPVVARHYRSVSPDRVRVERLTQPRRAYVSYRVGDGVYWTNHRVTLPAGELILTDGVTQIRARCGNCISDKAQLPTSGGEPDSAELDTLSPVPLPLEQPLPGTVMAWNSAGATELSVSSPATNPRLLDRQGIPLPLGSRTDNATENRNASLSTAPVAGGGRRFDGLQERRSIGSISDAGGSIADSSILGSIAGPDSSTGSPGGSHSGGPDSDGAGPGGSTPGGSGPQVLTADATSHDGGSPPDGFLPDQPYGGYWPGDSLSGTQDLPFPSRDESDNSSLLTTEPIAPLPVPEPSTIYLLSSGVVGALWRRRRSRRLKTTAIGQDPSGEAE